MSERPASLGTVSVFRQHIMQFDNETQAILFGLHPQHVDMSECWDSLNDLKRALDGELGDGSRWVLPSSSSISEDSTHRGKRGR